MRWYILRTLVHKELLRHLHNRGGIAMAFLLVVAAMLLSLFGRRDNQGASNALLGGGVQYCLVDFWEESPWIKHLDRNRPPELSRRIDFRHAVVNGVDRLDRDAQGRIIYPGNAVAIQIHVNPDPTGPRYLVRFWYKQDPSELAPYESWFWKETRRYFEGRAAEAMGEQQPKTEPPGRDDRAWAYNEAHRLFKEQVAVELHKSGYNGKSGLEVPGVEGSFHQLLEQSKEAGMEAVLASSLVMFALFFSCVYLLPSMTCEERERGILLAQALSPASPLELVGAKFIFYPGLGMGLGAILAAVYAPGVLARPFFWLALSSSAFGFLGIGMTISSLARTQREASMGAMCYLLAVSLLLLICNLNAIPLTALSVENNCTLMLRAALTDTVAGWNWRGLMWATGMAILWCGLATYLFRRYGWQ